MEKDLTARPTNIFNAVGAPTVEMLRQLLYAALTGNDNILTPFELPEGVGPSRKAQAARERKQEEFRQFMQYALATPERIERFQREMEALEERRLKLLERIDERLRENREKLKQLWDEAPEVTLPDGTRRKVFRDGDRVRDETGALVDQSIIRAEDVSINPRNWQENNYWDAAIRRDLAQRIRVEQRGDKMRAMERRAKEGKLTDKEADDVTDETERAIVEEERLFSQTPPAPSASKEKTFRTDKTPTPDFAAASTAMANIPDRPFDDDIKPPGPSVSGPAPM